VSTTDKYRAEEPQSHNIGNLVQREHPKNSGGIGVGLLFYENMTLTILEQASDEDVG